MKKFMLALLIAALFACCVAESAEPCRFIHLGDTGQPIEKLMRLVAPDIAVPMGVRADLKGVEPCFNDYCENKLKDWQAENGIDATGVFDVETMCALVGAEVNDRLVWLPMHGGHKYHLDEKCSGMMEPRLVTLRLADALGYTQCRRCAAALRVKKEGK